MKLWQLLLVATPLSLVAGALLDRPTALDARATCSALLRAACERQDTCPGCRPAGVDAVPCARVIADELPLCMGRAAPGETFAAELVGDCQRAMLGQTCGEACGSLADPPACLPLVRLAGP